MAGQQPNRRATSHAHSAPEPDPHLRAPPHPLCVYAFSQALFLSSPRFHMTMLASCALTSCFVRPTGVRQKIGGRMEMICDLHNCSCTPASYSNLDLHHAALICPAEGMMGFPAMRSFLRHLGGVEPHRAKSQMWCSRRGITTVASHVVVLAHTTR